MIYLIIAAIAVVLILLFTGVGVVAAAMRSSQLSRSEEQGCGVHP